MQNQKPFNPSEHLIQLKSKQGSQDYLPVQYRLVWFRQMCPEGTIETELVHLDIDKEMEEESFVWSQEKKRSEKAVKVAKGVAIFRATVKDGRGGIATGTKMEKAVSFGDYLEKAESGAIGRALAALGYGTQFAPELNEEHRIVDSPTRTQEEEQAPLSSKEDALATLQQISAIAKLCKSMGKQEPQTNLTYAQAKKLINDLSTEYNARKAS